MESTQDHEIIRAFLREWGYGSQKGYYLKCLGADFNEYLQKHFGQRRSNPWGPGKMRHWCEQVPGLEVVFCDGVLTLQFKQCDVAAFQIDATPLRSPAPPPPPLPPPLPSPNTSTSPYAATGPWLSSKLRAEPANAAANATIPSPSTPGAFRILPAANVDALGIHSQPQHLSAGSRSIAVGGDAAAPAAPTTVPHRAVRDVHTLSPPPQPPSDAQSDTLPKGKRHNKIGGWSLAKTGGGPALAPRPPPLAQAGDAVANPFAGMEVSVPRVTVEQIGLDAWWRAAAPLNESQNGWQG